VLAVQCCVEPVTWEVVFPILLAVGLAAGIISAFMGIGGGLIMVPVLHYGLDLAWGEATAASLLAITIQVPLGIWHHHKRRAVDWRRAALLVIGGAAGVAVGMWSMSAIPVTIFKVLFAGILALAAYRLWQPSRVVGSVRWQGNFVPLTLGVVAGVLSRWLGIGGGLITTPALVLSGVAVHAAIGTSLVAVWTNAALATAFFAWGPGVFFAGLALGLGGLAGAPIGARLVHSLSPRRVSAVLAWGLIVVAIAMAFDALRGAQAA